MLRDLSVNYNQKLENTPFVKCDSGILNLKVININLPSLSRKPEDETE